jgi:hypothetical protein
MEITSRQTEREVTKYTTVFSYGSRGRDILGLANVRQGPASHEDNSGSQLIKSTQSVMFVLKTS